LVLDHGFLECVGWLLAGFVVFEIKGSVTGLWFDGTIAWIFV
jgi:hypothetical protein